MFRHVLKRILAIPSSFAGGGLVGGFDGAEAFEQLAEVLAEDRLEHLLLRGEVVVEEAVRDTGFGGDVPDARAVVAAARKDTHGGIEDELALLFLSD